MVLCAGASAHGTLFQRTLVSASSHNQDAMSNLVATFTPSLVSWLVHQLWRVSTDFEHVQHQVPLSNSLTNEFAPLGGRMAERVSQLSAIAATSIVPE
jgi:hypothetical protein